MTHKLIHLDADDNPMVDGLSPRYEYQRAVAHPVSGELVTMLTPQNDAARLLSEPDPWAQLEPIG